MAPTMIVQHDHLHASADWCRTWPPMHDMCPQLFAQALLSKHQHHQTELAELTPASRVQQPYQVSCMSFLSCRTVKLATPEMLFYGWIIFAVCEATP